MDTSSVTKLLRRMDQGERAAADELYTVLYDELRKKARSLLRPRAGQTLQPTAVVHEAWLKIAGGVDKGWNSRVHFLRVAAKAMRSVLVDHARARRTQKRGAERERVPLDDAVALFEERALDLLELDDLLAQLGTSDPELAQVVELRFFAGLSIADTADALGVSNSTVERAWRTARAWLRSALEDHGTGDGS